MAGLFNRGANSFTKSDPLTKTNTMLNYYRSARMTVLVVAIFSAVNTLLLLSGSGTYFLFSATIPYFIVDLFMYLCGKYPPEFYDDGYIHIFYDEAYLYTAIAIAFIIIAVYVVLFFLSQHQRVAWLIVALVLSVIDTAALFILYDIKSGMVADILFNIYIIVSICIGIYNHFALKKLYAEEPPIVLIESEDFERPTENEFDSRPIRRADPVAKSKTLLNATIFGHTVIYRRVKSVNELIIDGNVYCEYVGFFEKAHVHNVKIDGHSISVGYASTVYYILVDEKQVGSRIKF